MSASMESQPFRYLNTRQRRHKAKRLLQIPAECLPSSAMSLWHNHHVQSDLQEWLIDSQTVWRCLQVASIAGILTKTNFSMGHNRTAGLAAWTV